MQGGTAGENKEGLYEQAGALQMEFSLAATKTPANITSLNRFVLDVGLSEIHELSHVPLPLLRGQKHIVVQRLLEKRKERSQELMQFLFQTALDETLEAINRHIEFWQEQMELMLVELAEQQEALELLASYDTALYQNITDYQRTGQVDRKGTGELRNEDAHTALVQYLEELSLPAYHSSSDAELYVLMLEARAEVAEWSLSKDQMLRQLADTYEKYKVNVERSIAIKEDLESESPARQLAGMMAYHELEKHIQLEINRAAANSASDLQIEQNQQPLQDEEIIHNEVPVIDILGEVEPFADHVQTATSTTPKL